MVLWRCGKQSCITFPFIYSMLRMFEQGSTLLALVLLNFIKSFPRGKLHPPGTLMELKMILNRQVGVGHDY
jgi:hypothetical protein